MGPLKRRLSSAVSRAKESFRPFYLRKIYFPLFPQNRPPEFLDCWHYPSHFLDESQLKAQLGTAEQTPGFLFFPMSAWHSRIQRTQQFALALSRRGHPCYVLNPHLGRQFPQSYSREPEPRFTVLGPHLAELHIRLKSEPVFHSRMLSARETLRLADSLSAARELSGQETVQVLSLPAWRDIAFELRQRFGWPIVYDCHDLIEGFHRISGDITDAEALLLKEADWVVFSSLPLLEQKVRQFPDVKDRAVLIRNGVELNHFTAPAHSKKTEPQRPTIGYFGSLDFWFDAEAVRLAALRHPDWRFLLAGRVEHSAIGALRGIANIELLGELAYSQLPAFLAGVDAAMIPFVVSPLTLAVNPIKLYEYFASGVPVVSARLPEVERYGSLVYIAQNRGDFENQIGLALLEDDSAKRAKRVAIARESTWDARVDELLRHLSPKLTAEARNSASN